MKLPFRLADIFRTIYAASLLAFCITFPASTAVAGLASSSLSVSVTIVDETAPACSRDTRIDRGRHFLLVLCDVPHEVSLFHDGSRSRFTLTYAGVTKTVDRDTPVATWRVQNPVRRWNLIEVSGWDRDIAIIHVDLARLPR